MPSELKPSEPTSSEVATRRLGYWGTGRRSTSA